MKSATSTFEPTPLHRVTPVGLPIVYGIVQAGENVDEGVPYIRSTDVGGQLDPSKLYKTSTEIASKYSRSIVAEGDIVFSLRGNIGETSIVPKALVGANLTQGTARISVSPNYNNRFVDYALKTYSVKRTILTVAKGSTFKEITLEDLRNLEILAPDLSQQEKISDVVFDWDRALHTREVLIAAKEKMRRGLIQRLLIGRTRVRGFQKSVWKKHRLGDLLEEVERHVIFDDDHTYRLASIRRRSEGLFFREELQGRDIKTKVMKKIHTGDFLISKMQVVHGAWGLATKEFADMYISDSYIALVPKKQSQLDINFLNYLSQMRFMRHLAYVCSHGVHIEKMTFNLEDFLHEKITLPPTLEEQTRIVEVLTACDGELVLLKKQLDVLRKQKQGMMQKLLTGAIRVKTTEAPIP